MAGLLPKMRVTIACTGVREPAGFEIANLPRVPGDAGRSVAALIRTEGMEGLVG